MRDADFLNLLLRGVDPPGTRLIQGDCFDHMRTIPDGSVDMALTDPPYGMSFRSNYRTVRHGEIKNDKQLDWLPSLVNELYRVTKHNSAHYIFCSWHHVDVFKREIQKKFKIKNILIWEKNNTGMGDLKGDFAPKHEMIIFFHKGRRCINGVRDPNILRFDRTRNSLHPTQKPVALMRYLMEKFSDAGDTVFDPFMGSGSTGVACYPDRRFIGIELDKDHFETARSRIAAIHAGEDPGK